METVWLSHLFHGAVKAAQRSAGPQLAEGLVHKAHLQHQQHHGPNLCSVVTSLEPMTRAMQLLRRQQRANSPALLARCAWYKAHETQLDVHVA